MTIRKRLAFAGAAIILAIGAAFSVLLCADLYLHRRAERLAGVNIWGYRGPRIPGKRTGEHRLVVLGGSAVFGYGVNWTDAFPAQLEADLRPLLMVQAPLSVVNLGYNSQGAYSFRFTLDDYQSLDYDAAILCEGYNDLGDAPNEYVGRRESPVFRLTGYYPVLHIALQEKAMALRNGGDIDAAYRGKTVFKPGLAARTTAGALDAAAVVTRSLNAELDRFSQVPAAAVTYADVHVEDVGCAPRWAHYCASVHDAVRFVLDHRKKVLIVTQPYVSDAHRQQQRELRSMLRARFGSNPDVGYADLGDAMKLPDPHLAYDGMHMTVAGNSIMASRLVAPIVALMPGVFDAPHQPTGTGDRAE